MSTIDTSTMKKKFITPDGVETTQTLGGLNSPNPFALDPNFWTMPLESAARIEQFGTPEQIAAAKQGRTVNSSGRGGGVYVPTDANDWQSPMSNELNPNVVQAGTDLSKQKAQQAITDATLATQTEQKRMEENSKVKQTDIKGAYDVQQEQAKQKGEQVKQQQITDADLAKARMSLQGTMYTADKGAAGDLAKAEWAKTLEQGKRDQQAKEDLAKVTADAQETWPTITWDSPEIQQALKAGFSPSQIVKKIIPGGNASELLGQKILRFNPTTGKIE